METRTITTIIESLVFLSGITLLIMLITISKKSELNRSRGWKFIITGYCFILFAILVDIIEDYLLTTPGLEILKIVLEGVFGFLPGFIFLSIGVWQWIPQVTALHKAKVMLHKSHSLLKSKARDYSLKLKEEKEKSKKATEEKQIFLNSMSHELRTPLNGIIGCVEIIMNTQTSPEQQEYLERANQSSDDLLNIINNILDLKEIEKDNENFFKKHFLIEPFVEDLIDKYKEIAEKKGLVFNWSLDHRIPKTLFGSPEVIKTAISKIIENSITYTEQGSIDVDVYSEDIDQEKIILNFRISDTGTGIPSEYHGSIFEGFMKVPGTDIIPSPGLGIGLTVAHELLSKMNGKIYLESSEVEKGSVFNASLTVNIVKQSL